MSSSNEDLQKANQVEEARLQFEAAASQLVEANRTARAQGQQITAEIHAAAQRLSDAQEKLKKAEIDFAQVSRAHTPVELTPLVLSKVTQTISTPVRRQAMDLLINECGRNLPFYKDANAQTLERIRLAVIKLANGNLDELRRQIETAKSDWRDVLTYAENPEAMRMGLVEFTQLDEKARSEIEMRDRQQYLDWLDDSSNRF